MKLHLACGNKKLDGFVNIDYHKTEAVDLVADIRDLDYSTGSAEEIVMLQTLHFFTYDEIEVLLRKFHKWLAPQGTMIISLPNLNVIFFLFVWRRFCLTREFSEDIMGKTYIHRSIFNKKSFIKLLKKHGFEATVVMPQGHWTMMQ